MFDKNGSGVKKTAPLPPTQKGVNSSLATLESFWCHLGGTLGSSLVSKGHFESIWCHFGLTLAPLVGPNGPITSNYTFS